MVETLELTLFGNVGIRKSGLLLADFRSIKAQALLCYLAVTGHAHTRSSLAGLLWGGMPESNARMNLSQSLSTLRRFFKEYLRIDRQIIELRPDRDIWLDVIVFETGVKGYASEINIPTLEECVQLYQGEFMDNTYIRNAPEFETWMQIERARLRDLALNALDLLSLHFAALGEVGSAKAIEYTTRLLSIEPWQEVSHRRLMRLLALSGRRNKALKQFEVCRQIILEEFGVEPSASTVRLLEQIRRGELEPGSELDPVYRTGPVESLDFTPVRATHSYELPRMAMPLIGRQLELATLEQRLEDPNICLVSITGPGGIGKTHLAKAAAHQIAGSGSFRDGVFFIPLSSVRSHSQMISAITEQLGLSLAGSRKPEETLFEYLHDKACLLVLDNFEQLLPEVELLNSLMQVARRSKFLVTSRERLKLHEEWVLDLEGLPYPPTIQEAQKFDYDAINLFTRRAQQIRSNFSLEKNIAEVIRICQLTQGMPLALEQAASLIRVSQAKEIADQIENNMTSLSSTLQNLPERHRSIRAVMDGSWCWLSEEQQRVFCKLSVFQGSFTLEAALQIAGASTSNLTTLIDKSLLRRSPVQAGPTRYDLHELVRQYAAERLLEAGHAEFVQAHDAHLDYYLSLSERAGQFWDTEAEKEWLEHLEAERANLHAALGWATEHASVERALRLNGALFTFWLYKSPAAEPVKWLETSLSIADDVHSTAIMQARAKVLVVAGFAALPVSDFDSAKAHFEEAATLYASLENQRGRAWALRGSGFVWMILGDLKKAQVYSEESQLICQKIQDAWGLAWSHYDLGNIALADAKLTRAESLLESSLAEFCEQGIQFGNYRCLISLGHLNRKQGNLAGSKEFYKQALRIQRETEYIQFVAQILEGMGHVANAENQDEQAVILFGASQARRDTIEMQRWANQAVEFQHNLALTKNRLSVSVWRNLWEQGYSMQKQDALEYARGL